MHLSRLKSDFVANVSHELKTPLALIRLFAETLELGRVPSEEKAQQYYRVINKESQRLTQLINNILDFSRIEAGRKEYRLAAADVGRIVGEVVDAYRFQIEQQGFTLEVAVEDDLPRVTADKEAIAQALLNLVNNALKYTRDEKYLRLAVARRGDGQVTLAVSDRGIGVAKGEQTKIFEKFYRAEDSLVHETKGSGLGLSLVQAHHGSARRYAWRWRARPERAAPSRWSCRSGGRPGAARRRRERRRPGPARRSAGEAVNKSTNTAGSQKDGEERRQKILIVEDEPDMVLGLQRQLRVRGLRGGDRLGRRRRARARRAARSPTW